MDIQELEQTSVALMEESQVAYVTTMGADGYPHTRAMFNLRRKEQFPNQARLFADHQDDLEVIFTTNTSSIKVRQIKADPRAAIYYCNPDQFHGLMLSGDIEIVDDSALRHAIWNEGWERYYPGGPDDPDHTVLRLRPRRVEGWCQGMRFEFEPR